MRNRTSAIRCRRSSVRCTRRPVRCGRTAAHCSKSPVGNLGIIRKLQGKIKRCEHRDQGLEKEEQASFAQEVAQTLQGSSSK